jgi:hypothetical protein
MTLLHDRRESLRFLAASPLFAGVPASAIAEALAQTSNVAPTGSDVITSPADALSVLDFEAAARKVLPPAHWGYEAPNRSVVRSVLRTSRPSASAGAGFPSADGHGYSPWIC